MTTMRLRGREAIMRRRDPMVSRREQIPGPSSQTAMWQKRIKKLSEFLTENCILKCEQGQVKFVMRIIYIMQGIDVSSVKLLLEISKVLPS